MKSKYSFDYKYLLRLITGLILIGIIISYLDLNNFIIIISNANLFYIFMVSVAILITWVLSGISCWVLTLTVTKTNLVSVLAFQIRSMIIGYFTPANVGETIMTLYLKKLNINLHKGLAIFLFNKILLLYLFLFSSIFILYSINKFVFYIILVLLIGTALGTIIVMLTPFFDKIRDNIIKKYCMKYYDFFAVFSDILKNHFNLFLINVIINVIKVVITSIITLFALKSINIDINFYLLFSITNLARLTSLIPVSVAGLGVWEGGMLIIFERFGFHKDAIISALLIERTVAVIIVLVTLLFTILIKTSENKVQSNENKQLQGGL